MQRKYKLFIYILAVAALVYMSCYTTFATGAVVAAEPGDTEPASEVISEPVSEPEQSEPVSEPEQSEPVSEPEQSEPVSEPESSEPEPEPSKPESQPEPEPQPDPEPQPQPQPQPDPEPDPEPTIPDNNTTSYYEPDNNYSYNGDAVASLYDVSTVVDTNELSAKDWNIVLDLNDKGKSENLGLSDFSFIKDEVDNPSGEDDGKWILYVGYTLVALGMAGILYVVASTVYRFKHKDKYDKMLKERKAEGKQKKAVKAGRYAN